MLQSTSYKNDFTNFFSAPGGSILRRNHCKSAYGRKEVSENANIFALSILTLKGNN